MNSLVVAWGDAARHERLAFGFVLLASLVSVLFSIAGYPAVGHDADVHLNWLDQFPRMWAHGIAYPRWLPMSNGGFGSPTFYFYPPLPYWIASFLQLFLPYVPSPFYNLMALLASIGSLLTCWVLARQYTKRTLVIATAALMYSFLAYRFADVFVRDALGEHWALMFLPLIFLRTRGRIQSIAVLSVAWSGLLLTNIPITVLAGVSVAIKIAVERRRALVVEHGIAILIAVAVSAVYLLPATFLRGMIHPQHLWDVKMQTTGFAMLDLFRFHGWLRFLALATLVAGAVYLIAARTRAGRASSWWWIALVAVVLQIPLFSPLWHLHAASVVQFSWRWDGVLLLAIAMAFAVRPAKMLSFVIVGIAVVTLIGEARNAKLFIMHPYLPYDMYRIDAPEYHPAWTSDDPEVVKAFAQQHIGDPPAILLGLTTPGDSIAAVRRAPDAMAFAVHLARATPVRLHLFYWPYWRATRDTTVIELQPDPNGIAIANLPSGDYRLEITLAKSSEEQVGEIISLIGSLALFSVLALAALRERGLNVSGLRALR